MFAADGSNVHLFLELIASCFQVDSLQHLIAALQAYLAIAN